MLYYLTRMNVNSSSNEKMMKLKAVYHWPFQKKTPILNVVLEERSKDFLFRNSKNNNDLLRHRQPVNLSSLAAHVKLFTGLVSLLYTKQNASRPWLELVCNLSVLTCLNDLIKPSKQKILSQAVTDIKHDDITRDVFFTDIIIHLIAWNFEATVEPF